MRTIRWDSGKVITIDQTLLPLKEVWIELKTCNDVAIAIKEMKIRGAPLIGAAAAFGMALTAYYSKISNREGFLTELENSGTILVNTRPTAINLYWAVERILKRIRTHEGNIPDLQEAVISEAKLIADEDVQINRKIGKEGAKLIDDGDVILTHCNAGALATVDYGTALGVIRAAWEKGKRFEVIADETRPLLQGSRLTAYELMRDKIPVTIITDNMAGYLMSKDLIDKVIVGADRIVRDGVANKIGTYSVAVLAHQHNIPFYVAAPISTFDFSKRSKDIVIEERDGKEIIYMGSERIAPLGVRIMNPAFDITPIDYVNAVICEKGVFPKNKIGKIFE